MDFADILKSLIPNASRATFEIEGATVEIKLQKAPEAPAPTEEPVVEGVSMEDIQVPAKPKKARKPKIHRTAIQMAIQRGDLLDAVKKMGKNGATSRELLGCGMPRETIYADLKVLEKEGHIIRSGKVYYPS